MPFFICAARCDCRLFLGVSASPLFYAPSEAPLLTALQAEGIIEIKALKGNKKLGKVPRQGLFVAKSGRLPKVSPSSNHTSRPIPGATNRSLPYVVTRSTTTPSCGAHTLPRYPNESLCSPVTHRKSTAFRKHFTEKSPCKSVHILKSRQRLPRSTFSQRKICTLLAS